MAGLYFDYVIAGACRAGLSCAEAIRERDSEGSILIISREKALPYKRTKLSKELYRDYSAEDFLLHTQDWYGQMRISLYLDAEAADLAPEINTLFLADGRKIGYGKLCIATGAQPIPLPEGENFGVRYLREKEDGQRLHAAAGNWRSVALIGTGIQSVELAEQFSRMHRTAAIYGPSPRLLRARTDPHMSGMIEELLQSHGIRLRLNEKYSLADLAAEHQGLVASVGIHPGVDWLENSGVDLRRGVIIDHACRSSVPDIFAAGDAAEPVHPFSTGLWHGAEYQGEIAGRVMSGEDVRLSDQFFRVKVDLFDKHFYLLRYTPGMENEPGVESLVLDTQPGLEYCRLFSRNSRFAGALFCGDPALGKQIITPMAAQGATVEAIADRLTARQEKPAST